ncbi:MAG: hypothetical protein E7672_07240 [Ruminococcaceae bacterium]|nr:hypothetical protein [Oscillospiraceae bacterium]
MKTLRFIIYAALCGVFCGLATCASFSLMGALITPYESIGYGKIFVLAVLTLAAIVITVFILISNFRLLFDDSGVKKILIIEAAVFLLTVFPSWMLWEYLRNMFLV